MPSISSIRGRIVFNSRGSKTIEIDVITDGKFTGRACAPSGASVGKFEAQSFPENRPEEALSMLNANINRFVGLQAENLQAVYDALKSIDSTDNYSKVGGSVAYALSIDGCRLGPQGTRHSAFQITKTWQTVRISLPAWQHLGWRRTCWTRYS